MPPPAPASLVRAVTLLPPHRHRPPFINHGAPSHFVPRPVALLRPNPDASINRILSPPPRNILFALSGNNNNKGAKSQAARWRWMSPGSGADERSPATRRGGRGEAKAEAAMDSDSHSYSKSAESVVYGGGKELPPPPPPPPRLLTVPTILTIGRVAAVPLLVSTFYMDGRWATTATTNIFLAAAITDWLDGYIARKMRLGSAFGAFLDPVADKLMVAATLVLLCTRPFACAIFGQVPWLLTVPAIAIIGREITMSAVREWAASQNSKVLEAVAVNKLGKWKTATQMTALTILLVARDPTLLQCSLFFFSHTTGIYISFDTFLFIYFFVFWRILQPTRQSCPSWLWCALALHISRTCCMVACSIHEEDMEDPSNVGAREREHDEDRKMWTILLK